MGEEETSDLDEEEEAAVEAIRSAKEDYTHTHTHTHTHPNYHG
jgi:hypothetical protein